MFEDSLVESGGRLKTKHGATTILSFFLEFLFLGVLVLLPLIFTEALPKQTAHDAITGAASTTATSTTASRCSQSVVKKIQTELDNGQLRTPTQSRKRFR